MINYTVLTDILLKMVNTEKEKVHIKTLDKCIYLMTFLIIMGIWAMEKRILCFISNFGWL